MNKINKKNKIIIIVIIFLIAIFYYFFSNNNYDEITYSDELNNINVENTVNNSEKKEEKKTIIVYVAGAVLNPGVYEFEENNRIANAIEKAGGLTEEADISKINLAYLLEDGMKINIPTHTQIEEEKNMNEEDLVSQEAGAEKIKETNKKININTATQSELETLPGIGNSTALKIIAYRNENGKFNSIDDIMNVKGIGNSKFENIKEFIYVK